MPPNASTPSVVADRTGRRDRARLRPGLEALWRGNGELQLGSDPRHAVRLEGLEAHETRWLASSAGTDRPLLAGAARHGVEPQRAHALMSLLDDAGLLTAPQLRSQTQLSSVTAVGGGGADRTALTAVHPPGQGPGVLERRSQRTVVVTGAGRTGAGIAMTLAAAGVGTLAVRDSRPVQTIDVGPGGFRLRDVGQRRDQVLAQHVADVCPATRVHVPGDHELVALLGHADLVVHVEDRAVDVAAATRLVAIGTDHLAVVVHEAGAVVGPLVLPGLTPCHRCLDLHRRDADDRWPTMAVQLRERYATVPAPEETATTSVAAAVAAAQALAHLDGHRTHARGATFEIELPQAVPRVRRWTPHPTCGCGAVPEGPSLDTTEPG
jgi:bacteriocin biosynthesis cyclodehydratase domain-containing protein